jgi:hypothetical protein
MSKCRKRWFEDFSRQISKWLRLGFAQFVSSESERPVRINDLGEFKAHAIEKVPRDPVHHGQNLA